ncbi:cytochrome c biogenesis CcdA family protein [Hansschlegelia plantiphila]|uniref:Cytochrome C biogenesis protein CcdA n=1 Tax=Hansschlegelia plantiphila TaxID=374655 RepID=A0A9W6IWZ3_9HYPH|nr:cytochrome c biogenesis CcdA family protein [Hansschlegelia plantiphila]GLK66572.1 cytochrome C biogenesis protein CcdA [Hansschlegelia plantiphila]
MTSALAFALLAGLLSILSPCVLPIAPLVMGAAASGRRFGPLALACGLALSFVAIGLFVATIGFSIGLDGDVFRAVAAALMIAFGVVLLLPAAQARFALAAGPVAGWAGRRLDRAPRSGLLGQFGAGALLGAVWAPCVGPTLGAASVLAARGENLGSVALVMTAFGIGAALPLLAIGALSRRTLTRWRPRLAQAGRSGKALFGALLILVGAGVLTGTDKTIETALVEASPDWLTALTTRF